MQGSLEEAQQVSAAANAATQPSAEGGEHTAITDTAAAATNISAATNVNQPDGGGDEHARAEGAGNQGSNKVSKLDDDGDAADGGESHGTHEDFKAEKLIGKDVDAVKGMRVKLSASALVEDPKYVTVASQLLISLCA